MPGAWFQFSRCLVPRCRGGWLRHDIVSWGGVVGGREGTRERLGAFSNVTVQRHSLPSDGAVPFRGATPNEGLSQDTSELKAAGATCRPHRPRLRLKLESTDGAPWQDKPRRLAWKRVCKTFSSSAWLFSIATPPPLGDKSKRIAVATSAVPHSIKTARINSVGSQPRRKAFCKSFVCIPRDRVNWMAIFTFIFSSSHVAQLSSQRHGRYQQPTHTHFNHGVDRQTRPLNHTSSRTHSLRQRGQRSKH